VEGKVELPLFPLQTGALGVSPLPQQAGDVFLPFRKTSLHFGLLLIEYTVMIKKINFDQPFPFELYLPEGTGPFPLICQTPILGRLLLLSDLFFERRFAHFFASRGFAAALIERPFFEFDPSNGLEQIQTYLDDSVERNRSVLDALSNRKEIHPERVGSFGVSFGGVVNTLWAASDDRLKAHFFGLVGGNLPEILMTSRDPLLKSYVREIARGTGFRGEDLKAAFQKVFRSDPLRAAGRIPKERVLMLLAHFDHVIRRRYGLALREKLGNPETIFLPLGHYTALLAEPILKWMVLGFFKKRL
jgi:hypothetical protein